VTKSLSARPAVAHRPSLPHAAQRSPASALILPGASSSDRLSVVGTGHTHAHDHSAPRRELASGTVRQLLATAVGLAGLAAVVGLIAFRAGGDPDIDREALGFSDRVEATVTDAEVASCAGAPESECAVVTARITSGSNAGDTATIEASADTDTPVSRLEPGDDIVLSDAGPDVPPEVRWSFADMQRSLPLAVLAVLFALVVVALGRLRGLLALAGIAVTMVVLLAFVFPALLDGESPLGVALTGATIIAFGTLYLAHGVNDRTTIALLGTLGSLGLTAVLAVVFARFAELSGLASEESLTLLAFAPDIDYRGLLLAAVILGTLGVLDDVTITQVSAVWELRRTDPSLSRRALYSAGIRIGRDHIASTVNTLVLAYTAAALPLLLIYTQSGLGFGEVLVTETLAVEIVQTLVGSIGLVASVPLTTALACWVITRAGVDEHEVAPSGWEAEVAAARQAGALAGPEGPPAAPPAGRQQRGRRRPDRDPGEDFWTNDPW
jgi:uncharacterized membrane protein